MNRYLSYLVGIALTGLASATPLFFPSQRFERPINFNSPDTPELNAFGSSLALENSFLLIGSEGGRAGNDPEANHPYFGAAFTTERESSGWSSLTRSVLRFPDGVPNQYGRAIAISGDTIVIGAPGRDNTDLPGIKDSAGEAFVYRLANNIWTLEQILTPSNPGANDAFGSAVAISGDLIVIGAPLEDSAATQINGDESDNSAADTGAAYVFTRDNNTWSQQAYLKPINAETGDEFGRTVAVNGDTVIVSSPFEDSSTNGIDGDDTDNSLSNSGALYAFTRFGTFWFQEAYLKASNPGIDDHFGSNIAFNGIDLIVGVPQEDSAATGLNGDQFNNNSPDAGAAYLFQRISEIWSQSLYLKASNTSAGDRFGESVAISGNRLLVGATGEDSDSLGLNGDQTNDDLSNSGAAYLFLKIQNIWQQEAYLKASDSTSPAFGSAVALSGQDAAISNSGDHVQIYTLSDKLFVQDQTLANDPLTIASGDSTRDFGTHIVGNQSDRKTFTIRNTGLTPLTQITATLAGDFPGDYEIDISNLPSTLASGESASFTVNFLPTDKRLRPAEIQIQRNNDLETLPFLIPLIGRGIELAEITLSAPDGSTITDGGLGLDFGSGLIGEHSAPQTFTLTNNDTVPLTGLNLSKNGTNAADFLLNLTNFTPDLDPGDSTTFTVLFNRNGGGRRGATLTLQSDDPEEIPFAFDTVGNAFSALELAERAYLKASNTDADDSFGYAVAIDGNTMIVGAPGEDSSGNAPNTDDNGNSRTDSGAAYVFVYENSAWTQQAYLKARNSSAGDRFGSAVAIDGDRVLIGSPLEDAATTGVNGIGGDDTVRDSGAAYLFIRNGTTWTQEAYIKQSNPDLEDYMGTSVALSGNTLVLGAPGEDSNAQGINENESDNTSEASGAAYLFTLENGLWAQSAYLKNSASAAGHTFGTAVQISGDIIAIGAPKNGSGAVTIFTKNNSNWSETAIITSTTPRPDEDFGAALSLEGNSILIGAPGHDGSSSDVNGTRDDGELPNSGAAYLFSNIAGTWSEGTFLKASNPESGDRFGRSVSLSGSRILVGSALEDSLAQGQNGNALDNGSENSGALHLYTEENGNWRHEIYLKSSNSGTNDLFGHSVSLSGDFFISGASSESGSANGINPIHDDNAPNAGAVYFYDLNFTSPADLTVEDSSGVTQISGASIINLPDEVVSLTGPETTLTLRNLGQIPLDFSLVRLQGTARNDFLLDRSQLPNTLEGESSATITLRFRPTRVGNRNALLTILSSDEDTPVFQISLVATGLPQTYETTVENAGLTGENADPLATPFQDGVPNLLKYAFNMDLSGSSNFRMTPGNNAGLPSGELIEVNEQFFWRIQYVRRRDASAIYRPQKSTTLLPETFGPFTATETIDIIDQTWERVTIEEPCDPATSDRCFYRVEVTLP